MEFLKDFLTSRKAQALGLLIVLVMFGENAGLSADQVDLSANGIMAYILARSIHDNGIAKLK
jgi:hypothetical protein